MKTRLYSAVIGIVAVAFLGAGIAFAQPACVSFIEKIPGITLDDAQKAKLQTKDVEHQKKMIRLQADHQVARVETNNLMKNRNFKKDAAEKQIRTMMAIETDMELERLQALHEMRGVLTDAQWKAFSAHMGQGGFCGRGAMSGRCGMMGGDNRGMGPHHKGMKAGKGMGPGMGKGMADCPYMNSTSK